MPVADIRKTQQQLLLFLLKKARSTYWGSRYHFETIRNYEDYRKQVPVSNHESLKPVIERIKNGEPDMLWPGTVRDFAVSSGTTGSGKHLPLTKDRLRSDGRFMRKLIRHFMKQWPEPQIWFGKQVSLPGSLETVWFNGRNLDLGEISGFTAREAPKWLTPFQVLSPRNLCRLNWKEKFDTCLRKSLQEDVRVITAVPSWTLIFLQEAIRISGKPISELWPSLKLIIGGGVALENYRSSIKKLCSPLPIQFMESYGASEGYFAYTRKLNQPELQLVIDNGIFYEWVPYAPNLTTDQLAEHAIPSWEIETGKDYIMLVTTNSGLWRYPVNDIIRFADKSRLTIQVRGRVSEMLDDYGEAIHYSELQSALQKVKAQLSAKSQQIIASVHPPQQTATPFHIWMIETDNNAGNEESAYDIAKQMDQYLRSINRHYAIRRESGALGEPVVLWIDRNILQTDSNRRKAQSKPLHILSFDLLPVEIRKRLPLASNES